MNLPFPDDVRAAIKMAVAAFLVLAIAPLCQGALRKLTAVVQSRQGPPLWQPYFDLLKLFGKEDVESGECPPLQRVTAWLSLASALVLAGLVPLGFSPALSGSGDILLLVAALTLCGAVTVLGGLAAGSTYSLLGMSREMMGMILLEPLFAVALVAGAIRAGSFRLDTVLEGSVYAGPGVPWSGLLLLVVMGFSFQAFVQRAPFDIAEAETELMEGPLMEYSGPKLGLFKLAQMVKLVVYCALFVGLFLPWGNRLGFPGGWLIFWAKMAGLVVLVTWVAATHARYRVDQALRYYSWLLTAAIAALVLATFGL